MRLETDRLILRPPQLEDLDRWAEFAADPEATRYLGGPMARQMAWRALMSMAGSWQLLGYAMFSVIEKSTGRWIGRLGPWYPEGWPGTEVGWAIGREHWGKGYAPEGSAASIDWAFDNLGWSDVVHSIAPDNLPSIRVAEKLGSRNLGPSKLPPPFESSVIDLWGQSREEWRRRTR